MVLVIHAIPSIFASPPSSMANLPRWDAFQPQQVRLLFLSIDGVHLSLWLSQKRVSETSEIGLVRAGVKDSSLEASAGRPRHRMAKEHTGPLQR